MHANVLLGPYVKERRPLFSSAIFKVSLCIMWYDFPSCKSGSCVWCFAKGEFCWVDRGIDVVSNCWLKCMCWLLKSSAYRISIWVYFRGKMWRKTLEACLLVINDFVNENISETLDLVRRFKKFFEKLQPVGATMCFCSPQLCSYL